MFRYEADIRVPLPVAGILAMGGHLAGSAVLRSWYNDKIPPGDYDIYLTREIYNACIAKFTKSLSTPKFKADLYMISAEINHFKFDTYSIDLIVCDNPVEVIKATDLDICRTYYTVEKGKGVIRSGLSLRAHEKKQFKYVMETISPSNARRVLKYLRYGYTPVCPEIVPYARGMLPTN